MLNLAHRGASHDAPENTLTAFALAMEMGADGIELDVLLSADGVPVVCHNFTVDQTTNGMGAVARLTVQQLRSLDAGSWFDRHFAGEHIPTLAEVFESLGRRPIYNIELKSTSIRPNGLEPAVIDVIEQHDLVGRVLLSSFNPFALRRARGRNQHLALGLLVARDLPIYLARAWLAPLVPHQARHPEHSMVDAAYMVWARRHGYRVNTWTVDEPEEMRRLMALGVDAIITDRPDVLRGLLAR